MQTKTLINQMKWIFSLILNYYATILFLHIIIVAILLTPAHWN